MNLQGSALDRTAFYLTCACVVSVLFSIAVSNILLALALAALLMSHLRVRFPGFWIPLAVFFAGTVISVLVSVDPASGRPQLRKFVVYLVVLLVYSAVRKIEQVRALMLIATGIATFSALWSLVQFAEKVNAAHAARQPFYEFYTAERITGFMSHWMTLGGQEMIILLVAAAILLFNLEARWRIWIAAAIAIVAASLVLGFTRSIWFGTFCGAVYLVWFWRRWVLLLLPIPIILLLIANPFALRDRVFSVFKPHGDTDSNEFRVVTRRAGMRIIQAHPWFGVGPEQVKAQLTNYIPADVPRPLPTGWYGHAHNVYIQYAAERGIPTLLAFLWMLGKIGWDFVRALRRTDDPQAKAILHGGIAVLLGILIVGYYEVNLGDSEVLILFLSVVACGYVAVDATRAAAPARVPPEPDPRTPASRQQTT